MIQYTCPECKTTYGLRDGAKVCPMCKTPIPQDVLNKQATGKPLASAQAAIGAYQQFSRDLFALQSDAETLLRNARDSLATALNQSQYGAIDADRIADFLGEPFLIERIGPMDYLVRIPSFLNLHTGWLIKSTPAYRTYRLNLYSVFGNPPPEWLKPHIYLPDPPHIAIEEEDAASYLRADDIPEPWIMSTFAGLVDTRDPNGRYPVRSPEHLFLVRVELVRRGLLLQKYNPVKLPNGSDLSDRLAAMPPLRPHQARAHQEFLKYGRIGVFLPPQSGKSYFGLWTAAHLGLPALVLAPTRALVQQWRREIDKYGIGNITVSTYQAVLREPFEPNSPEFSDLSELPLVEQGEKSYSLIIYDECHMLPANTFRRLACLKSDYSIGLSASPFREDGEEAQIYALTGRPVFCDWHEYFESIAKVRPKIQIVVCRTSAERSAAVITEALRPTAGNTLIYVEHIRTGQVLAEALRSPFYNGKTQPPADVFADAKTVVMSRVGDEGIRFPNLSRVIVAESIGDSRRQEIQRLGRLLGEDSIAQSPSSSSDLSCPSARSGYLMFLTQEERQKHEKKLDELFSLDGFVIEERRA